MHHDKKQPGPVAYARGFWGAFALFFALTGLWALATPLMASPDEPAHTIKAAAVVRGELLGEPTDVTSKLRVEVPKFIASVSDYTCFAFNPNATPNCALPSKEHNSTELTTAETSAGLYNPVYYATVGWPSLFLSGAKALYAMRLASALIFSALFAAAVVFVANTQRFRWSLMTTLTAATPMALFLGGVINPNGVEVASSAAYFAALVYLLRRGGEVRAWPALTVAVIASVLLANGRSVSLVWLLIATVGALLIATRREVAVFFKRPVIWVGVALVGLGAAAALYWVIRAGSLSAGAPMPGTGLSFTQGFGTMIEHTFDNLSGYIGYFGWLDSPAPEFAFVVWGAAIVVLLVAAAVLAKQNGRWGLLFLGVSIVFAPAIIQALAVTQQGLFWQGRYALALYVLVILCAGLILDRSSAPFPGALSRGMWVVGIWLLLAASGWTFLVTLRRYVVGDNKQLYEMLRSPAWNPPGTWPLLVVAYCLVLVLAALVAFRVGGFGYRGSSRTLRRLLETGDSEPAASTQIGSR